MGLARVKRLLCFISDHIPSSIGHVTPISHGGECKAVAIGREWSWSGGHILQGTASTGASLGFWTAAGGTYQILAGNEAATWRVSGWPGWVNMIGALFHRRPRRRFVGVHLQYAHYARCEEWLRGAHSTGTQDRRAGDAMAASRGSTTPEQRDPPAFCLLGLGWVMHVR